jgi:phosphopantothenoylcysteine decarboxylase/phosphopantothenate--cysteine ligase
VVANDVTQPGAGFGTATNIVTLVARNGEESLPVMDKRAVARVVLDRVQALLKGGGR